MENIVVFLFGLAIGSFLLVLINRLPKNKPVLTGRSQCDFCHHTLAWFDLVPLFSFILLGGKCRYCKKKLSRKYPLMELLTAVLFVLLYMFVLSNDVSYPLLFSSHHALFVFLSIVMSTLIVIFFTDLLEGIIPFGVVLVGVVITFFYLLFAEPAAIFLYLLSGIVSMLFFLSIFLATKQKGIGFGDVVYGFYMGLFLGFPKIVVGLYLSFLTGAIVSIILVVLKRKRLRGDSVPFGPFLIAGTILSFISGDSIWNFFRSYIGL